MDGSALALRQVHVEGSVAAVDAASLSPLERQQQCCDAKMRDEEQRLLVEQPSIQGTDHDASKEEVAAAMVGEDCAGAGRIEKPKKAIDKVDEPASDRMMTAMGRSEHASCLD